MMQRPKFIDEYWTQVHEPNCTLKDIEAAGQLNSIRMQWNGFAYKPVTPREMMSFRHERIAAWDSKAEITTPRWAAWFYQPNGALKSTMKLVRPAKFLYQIYKEQF